MNLKEALRGCLTAEEKKHLKTSYDIIGSIAIIEIDDVLKNKEKLIAEKILSLNKSIKTVLKKAGEHCGIFRTQKMTWLAGEKTKEAIHKENNTRIKLNVEKVYFSSRLSTERKRIMQQVKPKEKILVMFSGCGPYICVLAKNTQAKRIIGIELNPAAHKYAKENLRLNKIKNAAVFNADVNKLIPNLCTGSDIGIKSHWENEHVKAKLAKLKPAPKLIEIHIREGDLEKRYDDFCSSIKSLKKKGFKIMLHAPLIYKNTETNISTKDIETAKNTKECLDILQKTCKKLGLIGFIAHPYTYNAEMQKKLFGKIYRNYVSVMDYFLKNSKYEHMYLENIPHGYFSEPKKIKKIAKIHSIGLCLDLAHLYTASENEWAFYDGIELLSGKKTYFHIADSKHLGKKDDLREEHSYPVGKGDIDFYSIIPFINTGIIEVAGKNELRPKEARESYIKIKNMQDDIKCFDRILMPLPKSAEDFLPAALSAARKGTKIHFYDFLHESEFFKAEEKVKKACKKAGLEFKITGFVKCGQHSPRTYRVCLDFVILKEKEKKLCT